MTRWIIGMMLSLLLLLGGLLPVATGADQKVISTHKSKDLVITLMSNSGQWSQGQNAFVLEFTSGTTKQPVDVGKVTLNTVMPMPGMAPMIAGAQLTPGKTPGRYLGTI